MEVYKQKNRSRLKQGARGLIPCDLTVYNVQYFNVFTGEIYPAEVDILDGVVVRVREEGQLALQSAHRLYDGGGRYLIPGFIDPHMHIESTMLAPENLDAALLPWGTTTICTDPHEIANVMGIEGVRFMLENAKQSTLRQFALVPSCVPAVPGLEESGAEFTAQSVAELLQEDGVLGIAELMDFVGVYQDEPRMRSIIEVGLSQNVYLQGHAPRLSGANLAAYRLGGPKSDHESNSAEEIQEKVRMGMYVNMKKSSLGGNIERLIAGIAEMPFHDCVSICTDDVHAKDLLTVGHINHIVRQVVQAGIDPRQAIRFATLHPAREYHLEDLGAIAPGYIADMQLVDGLDGGKPYAVFAAGELVAEAGRYQGRPAQLSRPTLPDTINLPQLKHCEDFLLKVPTDFKGNSICVRVMYAQHGDLRQCSTKVMTLPVHNGFVDTSAYPNLTYVSVLNRYGTGAHTVALYEDYGLQRGAMASTIAHDNHNMVVIYKDIESAYTSAMTLKSCGGGICAVDAGLATTVALPVGGLMSWENCETVAAQVEAVEQVVQAISHGKLHILSSATISLTARPCVVVTDKGLIDGAKQQILDTFVL